VIKNHQMTIKRDHEEFYSKILNQRVTYEVPIDRFPGKHNDHHSYNFKHRRLVNRRWTDSKSLTRVTDVGAKQLLKYSSHDSSSGLTYVLNALIKSRISRQKTTPYLHRSEMTSGDNRFYVITKCETTACPLTHLSLEQH